MADYNKREIKRTLNKNKPGKIFYSLNSDKYTMLRLAYFPDNTPVMAGMMTVSPDGEGFDALFEDFEIKHSPQTGRD